MDSKSTTNPLAETAHNDPSEKNEQTEPNTEGSPQNVETTEEMLQKFIDGGRVILQNHTSLDLVPDSGKVVVFDKNLLIKHALMGLVEHDLKCGPVWDSEKAALTEIITVSDFLQILLKFYKQSKHKKEIEFDMENLMITDWLQLMGSTSLSMIDTKDTILTCLETLKRQNIHRLPVYDKDSGKLLSIVNHKRIFRFVLQKYLAHKENEEMLRKLTVGDLVAKGAGEFKAFEVGYPTEPMVDILKKLVPRNIYCVPLISPENGECIDFFSTGDVRYLFLDQNYKYLHVSAQKIIRMRKKRAEDVSLSSLEDPLLDFLLQFAHSHRMVTLCVNERKEVMGMVSVPDILNFFLDLK